MIYTLKIVVTGLALVAPNKHVTTTFTIPFEALANCRHELHKVRDEELLFAALANKRKSMKPQGINIEAACVGTGLTRA